MTPPPSPGARPLPVFLLSDELSEAEMVSMLEGAELSPTPLDATMRLATEDGRIVIEIDVMNQTDRDLQQVVVDLRTPPGRAPMSAALEHLILEPVVRIDTLPARRSRTVMLQTSAEADVPVESGQVRIHLTSGDGTFTALDDALWAIPAPHVSAGIDGQLDE